MLPIEDQKLLNELYDLLSENEGDIDDLDFIRMCAHNQVISDRLRLIRIEERLRGYGIER